MKTSQRILAPILILATLLIASPALAKPLVGCDLSLDSTILPAGLSQKTVIKVSFDQHSPQLHKKVEPDSASPQYLLTVHGIGYKRQQAGKS